MVPLNVILKRMKKVISLFFLALFLKIIFLFSFLNYDPSLKVPQLDSAYYLKIASNLKEKKIIPQPEGFFLLPPGYSYFLSLIPYRSGNYLNIYILQIILGAFSILLIQKSGERFFGKRAGVISAILFLLYGPATFYETRILSESIIIFFILLFFILYTSEKLIFQYFSGIVLGYLYLLRQNIFLFIIFLFFWSIFKDRKKLTCFILALPFFFIIPFITFFGTKKIIGTSAQAGIAFYMGNNPSSYGLFSDPIGLKGNINEMARQIQNYTEREEGRKMSPLEINYHWIKKVYRWAAKKPLDFFKNIILKIQRFIDNWEYGLNEQWIWGSPWITFFFPLPFALLISAGSAGFFLTLKTKKTYPLYLFFFSQLLVLMIFFPSSRHRFPLALILCLWAGAFFDKFFTLEKRDKIQMGVISGLLLIFSITGVPDERRKPDPFLYYNQALASLSLKETERANYWIKRAIEANWAVPFFHLTRAKIYDLKGNKEKTIKEKWYAFFLGVSDVKILNELGKWSLENKKYKAAERVFRRSVEVYPESGAAAINLSQVLYIQGKIEEARKMYEKGISLGGKPIKALEEKLNLSE